LRIIPALRRRSPAPVIATTVQRQNFPIVRTGVGNVAALKFGIDFKDGQYVKKGQLLTQLDPSTYQARLDEAEVSAGSARVAPHG
jgi:multidrug resistance efflux pump